MSQSKDQRRKKKIADKQKRLTDLSDRTYRRLKFFCITNDAPEEFVEAVKKGLDEVVANPPEYHPWEIEALKILAREGAEAAFAWIGRLSEHVYPENPAILSTHFLALMGQNVFNRIPQDTLLRFVPFHDVNIFPREREFIVYFRSLKTVRGGSFGTVYHSQHEPKLNIDGRDYTVAFSDHAIKQTVKRLTVRWPSYLSVGDVFAFFDQCMQFERCDLAGGQLGFTFFEHANPGFIQEALVQEVLGDRFVKGKPYCYRVGYCPAVIEGDFIKAKTLLFPGYDGTPEHTALYYADMLPSKKEAMLEKVRGLDATRMLEDVGPQLVKWFHDHGIDQARQGAVKYADAAPELQRVPGLGPVPRSWVRDMADKWGFKMVTKRP